MCLLKFFIFFISKIFICLDSVQKDTVAIDNDDGGDHSDEAIPDNNAKLRTEENKGVDNNYAVLGNDANEVDENNKIDVGDGNKMHENNVAEGNEVDENNNGVEHENNLDLNQDNER